jgi:hypothetical protein
MCSISRDPRCDECTICTAVVVKWFVLWEAKNPIAYEEWSGHYYRKDTGEYI